MLDAVIAVCDKTFRLYQCEPYAEHILGVEPLESIPLENAKPLDWNRFAFRHPRETKGLDYVVTEVTGLAYCEPGSNCC